MHYFFIQVRKYFFLSLLLIISFLFFYFHLYDYLKLSVLKTYQLDAQEWIHKNYLSSVLIYMLSFALLIACTIPCATLFALLGGFLFGSIAILYAAISTTLGGFMLFLAVRLAVGERLLSRSRSWIKIMEEGFQQNAFYYLLALRLMPIFPCWISNIAAGALNIPIKTFLLATLLGILPTTILYVLVGRGLDKLFAENESSVLNVVLMPEVFFPLLGLALISLFPICYKWIKQRREHKRKDH